MSRLVSAFVFVVSFLVVGYLTRQAFKHVTAPGPASSSTAPALTGKIDSIDTALQAAADALNKQGPRMLDAETRLDRAKAGPGAQFTYYYTLPNFLASQIDPHTVQEAATPKLRQQVCSEPGMRKALKMGVTYNYVYSTRDASIVANVAIDEAACG